MNDRVLSSEQAFEKAEEKSMILLDIRRPDEWQSTGIGKGAVPLTMDNPDFLDQVADLTNNDFDKPVGVICAAGGRSARVAQILNRAGYNYVFDVSEGMMGGPNGAGWLAKEMPVVDYTG